MLLRNGYPLHFIQNQISRFLDNKYFKSNFKQKCEEHIHRPRIILKLPFIGDHSLRVEKELQSFFHRYLSHNLSLNVVHTCFKSDDMFKHKEHQPKLFRRNVVYKLTCSCDSVYIGQARRNLRAIYEILCSGYNFKDLLIKETLLIHQLQLDINVDISSFPLYKLIYIL